MKDKLRAMPDPERYVCDDSDETGLSGNEETEKT